MRSTDRQSLAALPREMATRRLRIHSQHLLRTRSRFLTGVCLVQSSSRMAILEVKLRFFEVVSIGKSSGETVHYGVWLQLGK